MASEEVPRAVPGSTWLADAFVQFTYYAGYARAMSALGGREGSEARAPSNPSSDAALAQSRTSHRAPRGPLEGGNSRSRGPRAGVPVVPVSKTEKN